MSSADGSYPSRADARYVNESRLRALKTPLVEYAATDSPGPGEDGDGVSTARATEILNTNTQWVSHLQLKVDAKVMLVTASLRLTNVSPPVYFRSAPLLPPSSVRAKSTLTIRIWG